MTKSPKAKRGQRTWAWACLTCDGISEEDWCTALLARRIPDGITWRPAADGRVATKGAYAHRRRAPHKRNAAIVISGPRGMQVESALRREPIPEVPPSPRKPALSVEERLMNLEEMVADLVQAFAAFVGEKAEYHRAPAPPEADPSYR